jgi:KipI family sensor histidine kinase inhibitor
MNRPRMFMLGDNALVTEMPPPATLGCQERIWAMAERAREWPQVIEVVPGMNNLTVVFDPLLGDAVALQGLLERAWTASARTKNAGALIEIPVQYGGRHGPDLAEVAAHADMTQKQVVELHAATEYVVFFLGFQPGFAYLGGLDPALHTPRRAEPRVAVPAGSVAIGGEQTGVYPAVSPGGWQLIGHTSITLFDPDRNPPSTLQSGDRVRFVPVEPS